MNDAIIAQSRFGLGVTSKHNPQYQRMAKQQLLNQLQLTPAIQFSKSLPSTAKLADMWERRNKLKKAKKTPQAAMKMASKQEQKAYKALSPQRVAGNFAIENLKQQLVTSHDLNWRLFDFLSNHFSVSAQGGLMAYLVGAFEMEAIAPNMLAKFDELLLAVVQHPGMLIYLNNEKSFGPNSLLAKKSASKKRKKLGLNENLAREILELHTLGVNGGYTQQDVTELAKAITGWSVKRPKKHDDFGFRYIANAHEPGKRTVLGKQYVASKNQGERILRDLANHPNTAKHVCTKLATHFIADKPDAALIQQLTNSWLQSGGDLKKVMQTLIASELSWQHEQQKFKTPREYLISTLRLLDFQPKNGRQLVNWLTMLGQKPYSAGSPAGFPDNEADWNAPNALMARIQWVNMLANNKRINVDEALPLIFGNDKSSDNYLVVTRAESRSQAASLMLLSPEFLRR